MSVANKSEKQRKAALVALSKVLSNVSEAELATHVPYIMQCLDDKSAAIRRAAQSILSKSPTLRSQVVQAEAVSKAGQFQETSSVVEFLGTLQECSLPRILAAIEPHLSEIISQFVDVDPAQNHIAAQALNKIPSHALRRCLTKMTSLQLDCVAERVVEHLHGKACLHEAATNLFCQLPSALVAKFAGQVVGAFADEDLCKFIPRAINDLPQAQRQQHAGVLLACLVRSKANNAKAVALLEAMPATEIEKHVSTILHILRQKDKSHVHMNAIRLLLHLPASIFLSHTVSSVADFNQSALRESIVNAVGQLPRKQMSQYAIMVCERLVDSSANVRASAVEVLHKMDVKDFERYLGPLVHVLKDPSKAHLHSTGLKVLRILPAATLLDLVADAIADLQDSMTRKAVVKAVSKLCPQQTGKYANMVFNRLFDNDADVRRAAVKVIYKMSIEEFEAYLPPLVRSLEKPSDIHMHGSVLEILRLVPADQLLKHAADAVARIEHPAVHTLLLEALDQLPPQDTPQYLMMVLTLLQNSSLDVYALALHNFSHVVSAISVGEILDDHVVGSMVALLRDRRARELAARALRKTKPDMLTKYVVEWISHHGTDEHFLFDYLHMLEEVDSKILISHSRSIRDESLLHMSARCGNFKLCQKLVRAGVNIKSKSRAGLTPAALALERGHKDLASWLDSYANLSTTRGGTGNAFSEAMQDNRCIVSLEWYFILLPDLGGAIGGKHSLLAVSVANPAAPDDLHTYVIEKAATTRTAHASCAGQFANGVHISHWPDVMPNVDGDPYQEIGGAQIENRTGSPDFCMKTLRNLAVQMGQYDVATCNCHHAAFLLFNACAAPCAQVDTIPNNKLIQFAKVLQYFGIDVGSQPACTSTSRDGIVQSRIGAPGKAFTSEIVSAGGEDLDNVVGDLLPEEKMEKRIGFWGYNLVEGESPNPLKGGYTGFEIKGSSPTVLTLRACGDIFLHGALPPAAIANLCLAAGDTEVGIGTKKKRSIDSIVHDVGVHASWQRHGIGASAVIGRSVSENSSHVVDGLSKTCRWDLYGSKLTINAATNQQVVHVGFDDEREFITTNQDRLTRSFQGFSFGVHTSACRSSLRAGVFNEELSF